MEIELQYCQRKADELIVNTLTRSTLRSRRCLLQQGSWERDERLLIPQVHQRQKKRKDHIDDRREQLRRGSEKIDHARAPSHLLVDRSTSSTVLPSFRASFDNRTLLKSPSFVRVACLPHEEPVHRAFKPKESPLAWRRKPQETSDWPWCRVAKKSVRRSKCVWCVCVMTRCQVAQCNQNKMLKLPRTSLIRLLSEKRVAEISQKLHQIVELISRIEGPLQIWSSTPLQVTSVCAGIFQMFVVCWSQGWIIDKQVDIVKRYCQSAVDMNPKRLDWPRRCHDHCFVLCFVFVSQLHPKCHAEWTKVASLSM